MKSTLVLLLCLGLIALSLAKPPKRGPHGGQHKSGSKESGEPSGPPSKDSGSGSGSGEGPPPDHPIVARVLELLKKFMGSKQGGQNGNFQKPEGGPPKDQLSFGSGRPPKDGSQEGGSKFGPPKDQSSFGSGRPPKDGSQEGGSKFGPPKDQPSSGSGSGSGMGPIPELLELLTKYVDDESEDGVPSGSVESAESPETPEGSGQGTKRPPKKGPKGGRKQLGSSAGSFGGSKTPKTYSKPEGSGSPPPKVQVQLRELLKLLKNMH